MFTHIKPWLVGLAVPLAVLLLGFLLPGSEGNVFGVFGVSSASDVIILGIVWMVIGRGLYALHHSGLRPIAWLFILIALAMLLRGAYIGTRPEGSNRGLHLISL